MAKKQKKKQKRRSKGSEFDPQTGLLIDRLTAQDPNGETLKHFIESLKETLAANRELATAFVEELGKLKLEVAGQVFREIEGLFDEKRFKKAVKRTRFRLVQKGILKEVDDKEPSPTVRYIVTSADKPLSVSYFAVVAPMGDEMVLVYLPGGAERDVIVQFALDQSRHLELLVFERAYYKRRIIKELALQLQESYGTPFFEMPASYAAYLFHEGLTAGVVGDRSGIKEASREMKKHLKPDTTPLIYDYISESEIEVSRESLARATDMIGEDDFPLKLLPPGENILPADKLRDVLESTLVVNPATRIEQMEDIIEKTIREYFSPQNRSNFIRCMEELALYIYLKEGKEKSVDLLAVVKDIKDRPEKLSSNPFLKKLFTRTAAVELRDVLTDEDFEFYFEDSFDELRGAGEEEDSEDRLLIVPE